MITINLLPKERRKGNTEWMLKAAVLTAAVILIGGSVATMTVIFGYSVTQGMKLKGIDKQLAALKPVLDESAQLEEKQKLLNEKKNIIKVLVTDRIEWSGKLKNLAALVPDSVWLEELELRRVETKFKPAPVKDEKTGKLKPQKPVTIVDEFVDLVAVTADLGDESVRMSELMRAIQGSPFYTDGFEDLRHQRGILEPWLKMRGNNSLKEDDFNPDVWRFKLTMKRKKDAKPQPGATDDKEQMLAKA